MRNILFGLSASLCLAAGNVAAQPIPGADDPALREAALDWLTGENPREDLWRLGEIAADGNIAARVMVNTIYRLHILYDFPDMNRQERRALLPPDLSGDRAGFNAFSVPTVPALEAHLEIQSADSFEEWVALAEQLRAAGLDDNLFKAVYILKTNIAPSFAIDIARYVEANSALDERTHQTALFYRFYQNVYLTHALEVEGGEHLADAQQRLRQWGGSPWRPEDDTALDVLLRDGRWDAVSTLPTIASSDPELLNRLEYAAQYDWVVGIFEKVYRADLPDGVAPTSAELERLGLLVTNDAARTPYLQPLVTNCDRYCSEVASECVARGALQRIVDSHGGVSLDPVITHAEYDRSNRGAADMMRGVFHRTARDRDFGPKIDLPQCLVDASAAFAD